MKNLVQKTFENEFNETHYKELILNLFNRLDFSKEHTLKHQFNEDEKQKLIDFTYLGTFEDADKKSIDVLTVELKSGSKVERARSLQRNLIGKYLKGNLKDSALVSFYSTDNPDWRLSFVKMDYRLDEKGVKVDIGTPPKRYSFLVGKTEPSHTAQKQLLPLIDDRKVPSVEEIEKAFSVEKVTKEFYTEIAKKFTELVGGERRIGTKKIEEKGLLKYPKPDDTLRKEFAVRLIGRILFCWFLKKKKSDKGISLLPEETLSSFSVEKHKNYYHGLLEPLFFQVLNTPVDKRLKEFRNNLWAKIPFLNGGLFEPHLHDFYEIYHESGISKYINTLNIPDSWFKDLFDIFETYNFTIDESTSIDVDISVDPEMLGRIFENLLAEINPETGETARKSTGSYYTPRPIVEYMVDESLKQYLVTHTGIDERKLSKLLSYIEDDTGITEPEEDAIIDALDKAKIIDPACGSGAFPMGILHKMLLILQKIDPKSKKWLTRKLARIDNKVLRDEAEKKLKRENWDYVHKLGIIQNSIYGVDIQPIAVEISKLRFFLSLVVDEVIDDSKPDRGIEPLPNLEFKFVAANSLIGLPLTSSLSQMELFEARAYINKLKELRDAYFTSYGEEKNKIEKEFQQIQNKMFEYARKEMVTHKKTLETQTLKLSQWNPFADEASDWFDPEWMFGIKNPSPLAGEGKGEGGFDVVIANPPYVRADNPLISNLRREILSRGQYKTLWEKWDLYVSFIEKGFNILTQNGILEFIIPDAYMSSKYAEKSHDYFLNNAVINRINFCSELKIFEAAVKNIIIEYKKEINPNHFPLRIKHIDEWDNFIFLPSRKQSEMGENTFKLDSEDKTIGDLSNTLTWGEICYVSYGVAQSSDEIKYKGEFTKEDVLSDIKDKTHPFGYIEGKYIDKYVVKKIRYIEWGTERSPEKWRRVTFSELYKPEKIMHGGMTGAILDKENLMCNHSMTVSVLWKDLENVKNRSIEGSIKKDFKIKKVYPFRNKLEENSKLFNLKYLLAILNSKFAYTFLDSVRRSQIGFYPDDLKRLPIKKIPLSAQQPFIALVDQILAAKQKDPNADTSALERQIDEMVYALYGLTPEEIKIIENSQ